MSGKAKSEKKEPRQIANRRARFDYEIMDTYEAGIMLVGSEVKSVFLGRAHLADAYCRIDKGELFLVNMDIEPYEHSSSDAHERRRDRKLLLHRREIDQLDKRAREKGYAIVPLKAYFNHGKVKLEVALARGKAQYDKRAKLAADESRREAAKVRSEKF